MRSLISPGLTQAIPQMPIPPSPQCLGGNQKATFGGKQKAPFGGNGKAPQGIGGWGGSIRKSGDQNWQTCAPVTGQFWRAIALSPRLSELRFFSVARGVKSATGLKRRLSDRKLISFAKGRTSLI